MGHLEGRKVERQTPTMVTAITAQLKSRGIDCEVAHTPPKEWVITVMPDKLPEGWGLGIIITRHGYMNMGMDIEYVEDGEKVDLKGGLMEALARLSQRPGTKGDSAVTGKSPGATSNSVNVRKNTVIRV